MKVMVVPFIDQGHVIPCIQLSIQLASRGVEVTVVAAPEISHFLSPIGDNPLIHLVVLNMPFVRRIASVRMRSTVDPFTDLLTERKRTNSLPECVIFDSHVGWVVGICDRFSIPTAAFFTNSACSCALEYVGYRLPLEEMNPDDSVALDGLPENLNLKYADLSNERPTIVGSGKKRDRRLPPWMPEVEGAAVFLFNTCDDLERPFVDLMAGESGKRAFAVGPLLPERIWESSAGGGPLRDGTVRAKTRSSVSEEEVEAWLDSKPARSVVFVSFGSKVSPKRSELSQLAAGLEESAQPFIWVIQANVHIQQQVNSAQPGIGPPEAAESSWLDVVPEGFQERVGSRGLIIHGWAPQLLILSHPSTGGFLSHCGWNSTLESLACGVPILAWPIRGDQLQNAILVERHLKVGFKVQPVARNAVSKEDIVGGMAKLIQDREVKKNAAQLKAILSSFPASSSASLDSFVHYSFKSN